MVFFINETYILYIIYNKIKNKIKHKNLTNLDLNFLAWLVILSISDKLEDKLLDISKGSLIFFISEKASLISIFF